MSAEYLWSEDRFETQKHRRFRFGKDQNEGGVQFTQRERRDRIEMARICRSTNLFDVLRIRGDAPPCEVKEAVALEMQNAVARIQRYGCEHTLLTRQCLYRVRRAAHHLLHEDYRRRYAAALKKAAGHEEYKVHLGWQW